MSTENIKNFIDSMMSELGIPYFEISVCKGYEKIFEYKIKPEKDAAKDTLYMYSCTKPITVSCIMRLMEEGKITLDDKLVDYIPSFKDTYYVDESGEKHIAGHEITIGHLLSMRAGLTYNVETPEINELYEKVGDPTTAEIVEAIAKSPLAFRPGEKFLYSLAHDVLARVIEIITGMTYGEYVRKLVFEPLGMSDSRFYDGEDKSRFLPFYLINEDKKFEELPLGNTLVRSKNYESGGAGLVSTVEDYLKFAKVLANEGVSEDGYVLLKPETVRFMRSTESNEGLVIKSEYTSSHGKSYAYGLGLRIRTADNDWGLTKGEFGWDGAAGSFLMIDPAKNISVVIGMHNLRWQRIFAGKHLEVIKQVYIELGL